MKEPRADKPDNTAERQRLALDHIKDIPASHYKYRGNMHVNIPTIDLLKLKEMCCKVDKECSMKSYDCKMLCPAAVFVSVLCGPLRIVTYAMVGQNCLSGDAVVGVDLWLNVAHHLQQVA